METFSLPSGRKSRVCIVGAGASGMYAAQLLKKNHKNIDVILLEAQSRAGGRMSSVYGFAPWPVDIGAEFIHGKKDCKLYDLIAGEKWNHKTLAWPAYFFVPSIGKLTTEDELIDAGVNIEKVYDAFENIGKLKLEETPDTTVLEYLQSKGLSPLEIELADCIFANDMGTQLSDLGLQESILEKQRFSNGEDYIITGPCLADAAKALAAGLNIQYNTTVKRIVHGRNSPVQLETTRGTLYAEKVLVTLPVSLLAENAVAFEPPLPSQKIKAAQSIPMDNAMKVLIQYNQQFWSEDCWDIICPGMTFPEIWMLNYKDRMRERTDENEYPHIAVLFICGRRVDDMLATHRHNEIVHMAVQQMDKVFATSENPTPASRAFVKGIVKDWASNEYARGAYSHPTVGAAPLRQHLATPIANQIFFAGEATNLDRNPCVQGAMDSAERAVAEITGEAKVYSKL